MPAAIRHALLGHTREEQEASAAENCERTMNALGD